MLQIIKLSDLYHIMRHDDLTCVLAYIIDEYSNIRNISTHRTAQ